MVLPHPRYGPALERYLSSPHHPPMVLAAIERFRRDLARRDIRFLPEAVIAVCEFCEAMVQTVGQFAGRTLELLPYQIFFIANLWGFWTLGGRRRYTEALLSVPRKNGKSSLLAALALYGLFEEEGARVYVVANSLDQASLLFDIAASFARATPQLAHELEAFNSANNKLIRWRYGLIQPLHAEARTLDGLNPSMVIYDEIFTARTPDLYSVLTTGLGARKNPLMILAGSHSTLTTGFGASHEATVKSALEPGSELDHVFALVYEPGPRWDLHAPETWARVNPAVGKIVSPDYLRREYTKALADDRTWAEFQAKNLNAWPAQAEESWLPAGLIAQIPRCEGIRPGQEVVVSVDLSARHDLSACGILGLETGEFASLFWTPAGTVKARVRREHADWERWVGDGLVRVQERYYLDVAEIFRDIEAYLQEHRLIPRALVYDRNLAADFLAEARAHGWDPLLVDFPQWRKFFDPAIRATMAQLSAGRLVLQAHPLLDYCLLSARLDVDNAGRLALAKGRGRQVARIDGAVVLVMGAYARDLIERGDLKPEETGGELLVKF